MVSHEVFGKAFRYGPAITRQKYGSMLINILICKYYGGSYREISSDIIKNNLVTPQDIVEMLNRTQNNKNK